MREFKFRAWDKALKRMTYNQLNAISFDGRFLYGNADVTDYPQEVMQYTGLKDKNGKEIYEGDIISRENTYENSCVVKWDDESCGFTLNYICFDESYNMNEFWDDFEVIGNIHENPELLEGR